VPGFAAPSRHVGKPDSPCYVVSRTDLSSEGRRCLTHIYGKAPQVRITDPDRLVAPYSCLLGGIDSTGRSWCCRVPDDMSGY